MAYKSGKEKAKEIRLALKAMDINSKQVSVTCKTVMYDEQITAKIKDLSVKKSVVEDVVLPYNEYERDVDGEILLGGNTYSRVEIAGEALEEATKEMIQTAEAIISENKDLEENTGNCIYRDDKHRVVYFRKTSSDNMGLLSLSQKVKYEDGSEYYDKNLCRYAAYNENVLAEALAIFKYQFGVAI